MYYDESNFITVDAAVKCINSHSRSNPTIDMKRMMKGYNYITRSRGTAYNVFLVKKGDDGIVRPAGEVSTVLKTQLDVELVKKALQDKYREIAGAEFDEAKHATKSVTSVVDNGGDAMPRKNAEPIAKPDQVVGNNAPTIKVDSITGQYGSLASGIAPKE